MSVYETVRDFIRVHGLIVEGAGLVVAVSGGADSRCLLDCLHRLGLAPTVAHLDHGLRPESAREAGFVREIADSYGLRFVTERWQAPAGESGVEEAARWARYRFLVRVAIGAGARRIATGHTLSDQAETILLHLVRGAGVDGLTGMDTITDLGGWRELHNAEGLYLVRPLLEISHGQAVEYCRARDLQWLEDPSNRNPNYSRNLIRLEVMPLLEQINPQAEQAVARAGWSLAPIRDLLEQFGRTAWERVITLEAADRIVFDPRALAEQPFPVRLWVVRQAAVRLSPELEMGYETSLELVRALAGGSPKPARLPPGLELVQDAAGPALALAGSHSYLSGFPQLAGEGTRTLEVPGEIALRAGWRLRARLGGERDRSIAESEGDGGEWTVSLGLPADQLLRVRGYRPGDRVQPLGMDGRLKIGDLFTNEKVPVEARPEWPVVTSETGEVAWVAGLRLAHPFRVRADTDRIVILEVLPPDSWR